MNLRHVALFILLPVLLGSCKTPPPPQPHKVEIKDGKRSLTVEIQRDQTNTSITTNIGKLLEPLGSAFGL